MVPDHVAIDKRRHILVIAPSAARGGAVYAMGSALRHLDRTVWRITVIFPSEGPMAEATRQTGLAVEIQPIFWWMCENYSFWYWRHLVTDIIPHLWRLTRWIKAHDVDLVYTHSGVVFEGALAARLAGVPHVWHVHEVLDKTSMRPCLLPVSVITWLIGILSTRVIFVSEAARSVSTSQIPLNKTVAIHNGIPSYERDGILCTTTARAQLGMNDFRRMIVWIGQFIPRKNPMMLLRAIPQLQHAEGSLFIFVGHGPLEDQMAKQISALGLDRCCRLLPFQDDIYPLLIGADVLVHTANTEAFGLVLGEAGICNRPVIATRTEGAREIVVDGVTGVLVDINDDRQLAQALDNLLADDSRRVQMGQAAASRIKTRFSPEANATRIHATLLEAIGNPC